MIRHTGVFRLKHPRGSAAEQAFLTDARVLATIPGVQRFEQLRQTSPKNAFHFGFSMEFASAETYAFYHHHPEHVRFVQERWLQEVDEFMEIDYEPLEPAPRVSAAPQSPATGGS